MSTTVVRQQTRPQRTLAAAGIVLLPLLVGGVATLITADAMAQFAAFAQPVFSPSGWAFPVTWTVLYLLMGMASCRIWAQAPQSEREVRLRSDMLLTFGLQLALNFAWPLVFFGFGWHWPAFGMAMVMWLLVVTTMVLAWRLDRVAGALLAPLVVWTSFCTYLNAAVACMN